MLNCPHQEFSAGCEPYFSRSFLSLTYLKSEFTLLKKSFQRRPDFPSKFISIIPGSSEEDTNGSVIFFFFFLEARPRHIPIVPSAARQLPGPFLNITDIAGDRPDKVSLLFCKWTKKKKNVALSPHSGPLLGVNGHLIKLCLSLQLVYSEQRAWPLRGPPPPPCPRGPFNKL